jgi:pyruvate dehydrogenase E2 component (dihydrolipoamide acetyltransferase)
MAEPLLMLALSPTMEKGIIAGWQKAVGDSIETGDLICEVETDKATMDYEASQEGTLLSILAEQGDSAAVGDPIGIIGESGEDVSELEKKLKERKSGPTAAAETPAAPAASSSPEQTRKPAEPESGGRIKASPLARKLADEAGISLSSVQGSGPGGRVVKKDIEAAGAGVGAGTESGASGGAYTLNAGSAGDRREAVSPKRAVIARRLADSMHSAPHYYLDMDISMERLMALRDSINRPRLKAGTEKLSLNAFLVKLSAEAIARHPRVNTSWEGEEILFRGTIDIGLAVAQKDGLITPIVRDCRNKGIEQIDEELRDLIPRAQSGKLNPEEYEGAGFSITNLGAWGISRFTAVINPPASAILAVGATRPVAVPDEERGFRFSDTMTVTLGCDHRVIDGAVGAAFLADLKAMIEEPGMVLL